MEDLERRFAGIRIFSLPSVDHPQWGRHIELGVKGTGDVDAAYAAMRAGLDALQIKVGPEMGR
jgi:hypothetical protein